MDVLPCFFDEMRSINDAAGCEGVSKAAPRKVSDSGTDQQAQDHSISRVGK